MHTQELSWIQQGVYKTPWDMLSPGIKQNNPLHMGTAALATLNEFLSQAARSKAPDRAKAHTTWLQGSMYPQYFTKTFHYQTDGWFSSESAELHMGFQEVRRRPSTHTKHAAQ